MQFVNKTSSLIDLHVTYKNKEIATTYNIKFLRLTFDNTFSWKNHVDITVPKLSSACLTARAVKQFLSQESLLLLHIYGLAFWAILIVAIQFLNCKRELLELWWEVEVESHAENISGN
jgi:hypothetical protein